MRNEERRGGDRGASGELRNHRSVAPANNSAPDQKQARPGLRLLDFTPVRKNSLRGFATVRLPIGLVINDVVVRQGGRAGRAWALLPSKAMLDANGRVLRDDAGKIRYAPVLGWAASERREEFSRRVVDLVRQAHPEAFDQ